MGILLPTAAPAFRGKATKFAAPVSRLCAGEDTGQFSAASTGATDTGLRLGGRGNGSGGRRVGLNRQPTE